MRRLASILLILCLVLSVTSVFAASGIESASASMVSDAISGPGMVSANVTIKAGDQKLSHVTIVHGSTEAGSVDGLEAGASTTKSVLVAVSQTEFDAGSLVLELESEDISGVTARKTVTMAVKKTDSTDPTTGTTTKTTQAGTPSCTVTVSASKTKLKQGENVKLTYVVTNTGDVTMTYVELSESALGKINSIDSLAPGEKASFDYTVRSIASGFTAKPRVTYIYDSQTYSATGNSVKISVSTAKLDVVLSSSQVQIDMGGQIELTGTITNKGSVTFTSVVVSEETLGELQSFTNVAAGDVKTVRKTVIPEDSAVYQLTVTATDSDGKKYTYSSKAVTVKVANNPVPVTLSLMAQTDTVQLSSPGMVSFDISVQNLSNKPVSNVRITDQADKLVQTIAELPVGGMNITYECMVNQTTNFVFTATVTVDEVTSNFRSSPIQVVILTEDATTTAATSPTTLVVVTPAPTADSEAGGASTLTKVLIGLIIVIGIVVAALIALVIYGNSIRNDSRVRTVGRGRTRSKLTGRNSFRGKRR